MKSILNLTIYMDDVLGKGAFSEVYRGKFKHEDTGKEEIVAVKMIKNHTL